MASFEQKKKKLSIIIDDEKENNPVPDSLYENENKFKKYDFGDIKTLIANYIQKNISTTKFIKDFEKVSEKIIQKLNETDKKKFMSNATSKKIALDSYLDGIGVKDTRIDTYVTRESNYYYIKTAVCMDVYALLVVIIEMIYTQLAYDFFNTNSTNMSVPEPLFYFEKDKKYYYAYIKTVEVDDSFTLFKNSENGDSIKNIEKCYQAIHENLSKLNEYGIYHNDVNSGNLFFKQDKEGNYSFKLIDFGNSSTIPIVDAGNTLPKLVKLTNKDTESEGALIPNDFKEWIKGLTLTGSRAYSTYGGSNHRTRKRKQKKKASRKKRSKKNRRSQKKNRKHRRQ